MENKDYTSEILGIIRSNASPGVMRNQLEDYHENDLAEVFPDLTIVERRKICRILDTEMLSDIFEHIDEKPAAEYLDEMDVRKAAKILSSMDRCGDRCPEDDTEGEKSTADRADRSRYKRRYRCDRFF